MPAFPAVPANAQQHMLHLKSRLLSHPLRQSPQRRHRIVRQPPAAQAKKVRVLRPPVNVFIDESALIHWNALQHSAIHQQIHRAINRGSRNTLPPAMQPEKQIIRGKVSVQCFHEIENQLALARPPRQRLSARHSALSHRSAKCDIKTHSQLVLHAITFQRHRQQNDSAHSDESVPLSTF